MAGLVSAAPDNAVSLADVIQSVAPLLDMCVWGWQPHWATGIRVLRLVSKDMACLTLQGVQSVSVQAGSGAKPNPLEMSRVLKHCLPLQLDLTVIVKTGGAQDIPAHKPQLKTCILHAESLAKSLCGAKHTLTHLHLTVRLVWRNKTRPLTSVVSTYEPSRKDSKYRLGSSTLHAEQTFPQKKLRTVFPPEKVDLPRTVFEILSRAVPALQHLSILGYCSDAALHAFGANCPHLDSVTVEASSVMPEVLHGLHVYLPNLMHFRITRRGLRGNNLTEFVDASCVALSACPHLVTLEIDFGRRVQVKCNPEAWQRLPPSLQYFRSTADTLGFRKATSMCSNLLRLDLVSLMFLDLLEMLRFTPRLQALTLLRRDTVTLNCSELYNADGTLSLEALTLKQQLSAISLSLPCFKLEGTYAEVDDVMSWVSPIVSADVFIQLRVRSATDVNFMQHAWRVFPTVKTLEFLVTPHALNRQLLVSSMSQERIAHLVDCKTLKQIHFRHHILWTNAGLAQLCMGLPLLDTVKCFLSPGMNHKALEWQLEEEKPGCYVNLYCVTMHDMFVFQGV